MKAAEIAARRMRSSGLTGASFETPADVVRRHGAMQAQDYGPAKWSIGQRARRLRDEHVERAVADGSIVRTHVLRPTWHFVAREDLRWLLALTGPIVRRRSAPRYRELGLDARTLRRCERAIASALEGGHHLTRAELAEALRGARVDTGGQRLPWILMHCELEAVIASGPRAGKQHTYALIDERVPPGNRFDRDDAAANLVRRYLEGHGPATVRDLRWWSSLPVADIRVAMDALDVRSETIHGVTFWAMAGASASTPAARGVRLLQTYDELVVGYTESRHFGDPRAGAVMAAWRDRRTPNGVVVMNGRLGGLWRRTIERDIVQVDVRLFDAGRDAKALDVEVRRLSEFVGKPAVVETRKLAPS